MLQGVLQHMDSICLIASKTSVDVTRTARNGILTAAPKSVSRITCEKVAGTSAACIGPF